MQPGKGITLESSILSSVVLPLALLIVMLGLGLSLTPEDFRRILKQPKSVCVGIVCQMLILPCLAFLIAKALDMPDMLAIGLMALSLSPGGVTSNMFTFLARGNVALSITLTAIVSLLTPVTVPIVLQLVIKHFLGLDDVIEIPFIKTVLTLIGITVIPVCAGMYLKHRSSDFAAKCENTARMISILFLFLIVVALIIKNIDNIGQFFAQAGLASLVLNVSGLMLGTVVAKLLLKNNRDACTIGLETGIQNGTTALFITATLLGNATMAIPPAVYSLLMFPTGALASVLFSKLILRYSSENNN